MNYGTISLTVSRKNKDLPFYAVECLPHVRMKLKRLFTSIVTSSVSIRIGAKPSNSEDLNWFLSRFPMECTPEALELLEKHTREQTERREITQKISQQTTFAPSNTVVPLREYQNQAVELAEVHSRLLVGDSVGLGKTAIAFGLMSRGHLPAVVVCQNHLQAQWQQEAWKFLGVLTEVHIVKTRKAYTPPPHQILIIPYSKLSGWADYLEGYASIYFDEGQELRRADSIKYRSASVATEIIPLRVALTATPIYNYGDEIFNVLDIIAPGEMGSREEFLREWCIGSYGGRYQVKEPIALGAYLRESALFLRRDRKDVGRELPGENIVVETVSFNEKMVLQMEEESVILAKAVLQGEFTERGRASRELDIKMRQVTGIAKAPFVAEFVADMVEAGEKVLLGGWHREVYDIWRAVFDRRGIKHAMYTGTENPAHKENSKQAFLQTEGEGRADVLIMSLRSGSGLNGLQNVCSVAVVGELDWSPKVHEQFFGRIGRDGQEESITGIYLVSGGGVDPLIAGMLGLKNEQSAGIVDMSEGDDTFNASSGDSRTSDLAKSILSRHKDCGPLMVAENDHDSVF